MEYVSIKLIRCFVCGNSDLEEAFLVKPMESENLGKKVLCCVRHIPHWSTSGENKEDLRIEPKKK